jgi:hypothetical protein
MPNKRFLFVRAAVLACLLSAILASRVHSQQTSPEIQAAYNLYSQGQYAASAAAFEKIISVHPSARLCYCAALANRANHKEARAQQLFHHIVSTYPKSPEAGLAKNAMASGVQVASSSSSGSDELPAIIKNALPPEMQALLNTEVGKRAVQDALKQHAQEVEGIKAAERSHTLSEAAVANAVNTATATASPYKKQGNSDNVHPFSPGDIAREGAAGIDQSRYPNCWFEASMAALADLPRGQRLLSSMIRLRGKDQFVVRFPGDATEYLTSVDDLKQRGLHDRAMWASVIEAAQIEKFPDNRGSSGTEGDQSRLEVGLGCITGCKAEVLRPAAVSEAEVSSFIAAAVRSGNPVVAGTYGDDTLSDLPPLVVPTHAYTVIGLDPGKNMVILRNPWGRGTERFELPHDPNHFEFEALENGKCKMSISQFQKYFHSVCRSFI